MIGLQSDSALLRALLCPSSIHGVVVCGFGKHLHNLVSRHVECIYILYMWSSAIQPLCKVTWQARLIPKSKWRISQVPFFVAVPTDMEKSCSWLGWLLPCKHFHQWIQPQTHIQNKFIWIIVVKGASETISNPYIHTLPLFDREPAADSVQVTSSQLLFFLVLVTVIFCAIFAIFSSISWSYPYVHCYQLICTPFFTFLLFCVYIFFIFTVWKDSYVSHIYISTMCSCAYTVLCKGFRGAWRNIVK